MAEKKKGEVDWYARYEARRRAAKAKLPKPSTPHKWGGYTAGGDVGYFDMPGIVTPGPECCGYVEMMGCGQICEGCPRKTKTTIFLSETLKDVWAPTWIEPEEGWSTKGSADSRPFTLETMMKTIEDIKKKEKLEYEKRGRELWDEEDIEYEDEEEMPF